MSRRVPRFHLIGPLGVLNPGAYVALAVRLAASGCDAVHLRVPELPGGDALRLARSMKREIGGSGTMRLFVNDRLDVAALAGADGVQLGERSFDPRDARRLIASDVLVGRSIHDLEGAKAAESAGADFVMAGHVYDTESKPDEPGRGLDWLSEIATDVTVPVIAIGGITAARVGEVLAAGAYGIAVGRELLAASDPVNVARRIAQQIERHGGDESATGNTD